jgi:hypothetical protein
MIPIHTKYFLPRIFVLPDVGLVPVYVAKGQSMLLLIVSKKTDSHWTVQLSGESYSKYMTYLLWMLQTSIFP